MENSGGNFLTDGGSFHCSGGGVSEEQVRACGHIGPGVLQSSCCRHVYSRSCFCVNIFVFVLSTESQTATVRYLILILKVIRTEM